MVQRKGKLPVKDSRSSEERAQEDLDVMAAASMVRVPMAPPALGDLPPYSAEGTGESEPELVLPSQICQGTKFGGGRAPTGAGQYPLLRLPVGGVGPEGQPAGYYWAHTLLSTSDLLNWKSSNPSYRNDCTKMTDLAASVFATHHPNWADIQALLNILLTRDERRLVLDKANEETRRLHQENPDGALNPTRAIPLAKPNWDPNGNGLPF